MSRFAVAALVGLQVMVDACSRLVYESKGNYYAARSLDWFENPESDIWAFPAKMERDGGMGEGSLQWTSKYGSVIASGYSLLTVEGMNTEGLVGNMLYLTETKTGGENKPGAPKMSIGALLQHALDMFASVAEAVEYYEKDEIAVYTPPLPMGKAPSLHLSLSDASGDNAVFEWLDGKIYVHHSRDYNVMTNSPRFEEQLAISGYWKLIGVNGFLPGSHRAADRFVRLVYNIDAVGKTERKNREEALATTLSLIRHISVPFGVTDPEKPNLASTYSRQLYDHSEKIFYFEDALSPNTFFIELNKIDLSEGSGVRKLSFWMRWLTGEVSHEFVPHEPFEFLDFKHSDGTVDPPEYATEKPRCVKRNTKMVKYKRVEGGRIVGRPSMKQCNDGCFSKGAEAFNYAPEEKPSCVCVNERTGGPVTKLEYAEGTTFGYTMEYFSDAACAGRILGYR